jgi:hypothetical protein
VSGAADVHVFDESNFRVVTSRELDQRHELVIVDAADDDGIELET